MRETGVYTRLFVGLVSPLASLRLNPPLMALRGLVFCFRSAYFFSEEYFTVSDPILVVATTRHV